jgi:NAD+ kinase
MIEFVAPHPEGILPMLRCIGVLAHPRRPQTAPVALSIADSLKAHGVDTWLHTEWDENTVQEEARCADMVVAIGGDGAMLKAARVCAPFAVPVLGVNMGRLGFLTEVRELDDWEATLERLIGGDYWVEMRMMITVSVRRNGVTRLTSDALNDVVISANGIGNMIQIDTYIDSHWTTTYNSDALIIATPTGSTAYALAAGGPILPPDLKNILIVPTAPHLSMDRSIVLSEGSQVAVRANEGNRNPIVLTADGVALGKIEHEDTIIIQASQHSSRFVRLRSKNYFYRSLLDRLEPRVTHKPQGTLDLIEETK